MLEKKPRKLSKGMKGLYNENFKILKKEIDGETPQFHRLK